jgi:hypothetical protein
MKIFLGVEGVEKGGGDEENHCVGNGVGYDACIYWRMLAMVV